MGNWRFWAGFGIGLAAGAAIALIYAPQSGVRTRRQLRRNWEDASEYIRDTASTVGEQAEKCFQRSREAVGDFTDQAQTVVKTAKRVVTFS
jgi:gas vesicle protein